MQTIKHYSSVKLNFLTVAIICIALLFSSCAKKLSFGVSSVLPAAKGYVKVKKDKNQNYSVDVEVTNFAPASRLTPAKKTYVVWVVTETNGTKNIGQINASSSLLSSNYKGSLKTVTSFKPVSFYITAEDDATIQYPSGSAVLNTNG